MAYAGAMPSAQIFYGQADKWLFYLFGFNTAVAVYIGFIALAG